MGGGVNCSCPLFFVYGGDQMTDKQKESIALLRDCGVSVTEIAERLGLSVNTIKSYCKRHALKAQTKSKRYCLQCHNLIRQNLHRKAKKFCCDRCRVIWWGKHSSLLRTPSKQTFICPVCHGSFSAYPSTKQKYCSRLCYARSREAAHE